MTTDCIALLRTAAVAQLLLGAEVAVAESEPERVEGYVAVSVPGCGVFVVESRYGLSVVRQQQYHAVFEGDRVRGLLAVTGEHEIEIVDEMTVRAVIIGTGLTITEARQIVDGGCRPSG